MRKLLTIGFVIIGLALANRSAAQAPSAVADTETERAIDRYMRKAEANGFAGSVLAARGDAVILAKGYGLADREKKTAQTAETVFSIGSITKQFTGAAILTLETAGKLSVTDRITRFFRRPRGQGGHHPPPAPDAHRGVRGRAGRRLRADRPRRVHRAGHGIEAPFPARRTIRLFQRRVQPAGHHRRACFREGL